jgi:hypothetical protein
MPALAEPLDIPMRTWANYEGGVVVPARIVLSFIDLTGASPGYLLRREGARYSSDSALRT